MNPMSDKALLDVTKQKDLSGFYRHILKQTAGEEDNKEDPKDAEKHLTKKPENEESSSIIGHNEATEAVTKKDCTERMDDSDDGGSERLRKLAALRKKALDNLKRKSDDISNGNDQEKTIKKLESDRIVKKETKKIKKESENKKVTKRSVSYDSEHDETVRKSKETSIQELRNYRKRHDSGSDDNSRRRRDKERKNDSQKHNDSHRKRYENDDRSYRRDRTNNYHSDKSHKSQDDRHKKEKLSSRNKSRHVEDSSRDRKEKSRHKSNENKSKHKDEKHTKVNSMIEEEEIEWEEKVVPQIEKSVNDVETAIKVNTSVKSQDSIETVTKNIFARRNNTETIRNAKERFLARKLAKLAEKIAAGNSAKE